VEGTRIGGGLAPEVAVPPIDNALLDRLHAGLNHRRAVVLRPKKNPHTRAQERGRGLLAEEYEAGAAEELGGRPAAGEMWWPVAFESGPAPSGVGERQAVIAFLLGR
jgi:hypothetical protein